MRSLLELEQSPLLRETIHTCKRNLINHLLQIEQFSRDSRQVIGFEFLHYTIGLKKLAPLFYPIRGETRTSCDAVAHVFPRIGYM